jgi:hypothetical protein
MFLFCRNFKPSAIPGPLQMRLPEHIEEMDRTISELKISSGYMFDNEYDPRPSKRDIRLSDKEEDNSGKLATALKSSRFLPRSMKTDREFEFSLDNGTNHFI